MVSVKDPPKRLVVLNGSMFNKRLIVDERIHTVILLYMDIVKVVLSKHCGTPSVSLGFRCEYSSCQHIADIYYENGGHVSLCHYAPFLLSEYWDFLSDEDREHLAKSIKYKMIK